MLPSGQVVIDGEKFDAISEGFPIEPGDRIIVSDVRGNRIYVEPYEGEDETEDQDLPVRDRESLEQPIEDFDINVDTIDDSGQRHRTPVRIFEIEPSVIFKVGGACKCTPFLFALDEFFGV